MKVSGGLFTAKLRLHFTLKRHHFIQGHVKVKCTSSIYTEYFQSNSLSLPGIGLGEKALGISGRSIGKKQYYLQGHITRYNIAIDESCKIYNLFSIQETVFTAESLCRLSKRYSFSYAYLSHIICKKKESDIVTCLKLYRRTM